MIILTSSKKVVKKQFEAKRRQSRSMSLVVFENPMYTNSFSLIEIQGGPGFTDLAISCILEPFRLRVLRRLLMILKAGILSLRVQVLAYKEKTSFMMSVESYK